MEKKWPSVTFLTWIKWANSLGKLGRRGHLSMQSKQKGNHQSETLPSVTVTFQPPWTVNATWKVWTPSESWFALHFKSHSSRIVSSYRDMRSKLRRKTFIFPRMIPDWLRQPTALQHTQGAGPTQANRCHTCAKTYDHLMFTHPHTSLKLQSGHSSTLTVKWGIEGLWQYFWSHMVLKHTSHHLTQHLGRIYVESRFGTLLLRVIMCHISLFVSFVTQNIWFCGRTGWNLHEYS